MISAPENDTMKKASKRARPVSGNPTHLGRRVQAWRKFRGWTAADLAMRAGLVGATVTQLEAGVNRDPRTSTLDAILAALGVTRERLEEMTPAEVEAAANPALAAPAA